MAINQRKVAQDKDEIIAKIPDVCRDEASAVEFVEQLRWADKPCCAHCGSTDVYKMVDSTNPNQRNKRFLWRCRSCRKQYTVRVNSVMQDSPIPMRHWVYAFWRASTSKKGVAALEIKRQTGVTYRSALFMMHRIRFAMASPEEKLTGVIEADETFCGGRGSDKTPVFAAVQRGGEVRTRVLANVTGENLSQAIDEFVDKENSKLMTDDWKAYRRIGRQFSGGHDYVRHSLREYSRAGKDGERIHTNTVEGFFSIVKRGINGIYHSVSSEHLHRYMSEFAFRYNRREMTDGERTAEAIQGAEGKRLYYRTPSTR